MVRQTNKTPTARDSNGVCEDTSCITVLPAEQVVLKVPQELLFRQKDCSGNGQDSQHPDTDVADLEPHRRLLVLMITAHSNEYELLAIKNHWRSMRAFGGAVFYGHVGAACWRHGVPSRAEPSP